MFQQPVKLNGMQIETIVNKIVPLIAAEKDHEFFRAMLTLKAEESSSTQFSAFIGKLLRNQA